MSKENKKEQTKVKKTYLWYFAAAAIVAIVDILFLTDVIVIEKSKTIAVIMGIIVIVACVILGLDNYAFGMAAKRAYQPKFRYKNKARKK